MEFKAETVWACAAAAHRINEGYLKEDQWMHNATPPFCAKRANKAVVKDWLRTTNYSDLTEEDYAKGRAIRDHFKGYTFKAIQGQLNDFQAQALRLATTETFTGRDMLAFAIISCLPSVAERDEVHTTIKKEVYASTQLEGNVGDSIIGDLDVVKTAFSRTYNKYKIVGTMGESYVDFWHTEDFVAGTTVRIKARIKNFRDDKTTQLNYVKKA